MSKRKRRARAAVNAGPAIPENLEEVKVLSVPAIFGKRLAVSGEKPETAEKLMRVCGRLRRVMLVGGTRGYGVRLYGDFFATLARPGDKRVRVVHGRIAFLPDPITRQAMAAEINAADPDAYYELDCDVWAIADPAEPTGARLKAVGLVTPPADPIKALLTRSGARADYSPEEA